MKKVMLIAAVTLLSAGFYTLDTIINDDQTKNLENLLATDGEDSKGDNRGDAIAFTDGEDSKGDNRGDAIAFTDGEDSKGDNRGDALAFTDGEDSKGDNRGDA